MGLFETLFRIIEVMEKEIGNGARISFSKYENGLMLKAYWPDGYILQHKFDKIELYQIKGEEFFMSHFIKICKEGHPHLARFT